MGSREVVKKRSSVVSDIEHWLADIKSNMSFIDVMEHNAEMGTMLDPTTTPSTTIGVSDLSLAEQEENVIPLSGDETHYLVVPHESAAAQPSSMESHNFVVLVEKTNLSELESGSLAAEEKVLDFPREENSKQQENKGVQDLTKVAITKTAQEDPSNESLLLQLEDELVGQTKQEEAPSLMVENQEVVPDVVNIVGQTEVPAIGDDHEKREEVLSLQGVELLKQEVAHRSHILGSLSKLDENSARQLLNDSGWNVSQSIRQNGKTQWYYRSPPPKPVLLGSLTSAVSMWKRLVDEDRKEKGGGDEDPYPMVTAFLSNAKRPTTARKRKRGRHND